MLSVWNFCAVPQTAFRGEIVGGVAKCRLFSGFTQFRQFLVGSPQQRVAPLRGPITVPPLSRSTTTLPGTMYPTLNEQCAGSLTSNRIYVCKGCEVGPSVYRPYPRRLESLTVFRCLTKAVLSPQLFKHPECWSGRAFNQFRPPARQTGAYLIKLTLRRQARSL